MQVTRIKRASKRQSQTAQAKRRRAGRAKRKARQRLEYLRGEIQAERISYGEIVELESLAEFIEDGDTELLLWAGTPENGAWER